MRVAFIIHEFPKLSQTFLLNQIKGLIEHGHEVDIYAESPKKFTKTHSDIERYDLLSRTNYFQMPCNYLLRLLKGIGLLFVVFCKTSSILLHLLKLFIYHRKAMSLMWFYAVALFPRNKSYDIIHCQFGELGLVGMLLRKIGIKGKLITAFRHEIIGYPQNLDFKHRLIELGCDKAKSKHIYDRLFDIGDLFLPNCEYFKHRLIELGCDKAKIIVHRSGIDVSRFSFTQRRPNPNSLIRIVTIGRLVEKKGIEFGIHAIAKLRKVHQNIEYNIIGYGPLKRSLQQLIEKLDMNKLIKLLGGKQQWEIIEILNNSHILIAPSVTSKDGNQEGIPNVLKEAMAMGLPVISTQHAGIPELIEDGVTGFLVPERDVDTLAEKLNYLISNPEIWPHMCEAARAHVEEHYDKNKLNNELIEIYHHLLRKNNQ